VTATIIACAVTFAMGLGLGHGMGRESERLDRFVDEVLGDVDGLYIDRGMLRDDVEGGRW
jgi:hypothetical protein